MSPAAAATRIRAPVLLIHGAEDRETPPAHSERIYRALPGPKNVLLVSGAHHNDALGSESWREIDAWVAAQWPAR